VKCDPDDPTPGSQSSISVASTAVPGDENGADEWKPSVTVSEVKALAVKIQHFRAKNRAIQEETARRKAVRRKEGEEEKKEKAEKSTKDGQQDEGRGDCDGDEDGRDPNESSDTTGNGAADHHEKEDEEEESIAIEVDEQRIQESYDRDVHCFEVSMMNCYGLKALHQVG
jgi:cobalamin biosynthesis protein CobT